MIYLQQILLQGVSRFLLDDVELVVGARSDSLSTPAVTICPYDENK